jgi:hypothetical protein
MVDTRYLAATAYTSPEQMVVHFVNYDHEEGADITTPTGPVDIEITLPENLQFNSPTLYLFTPGEMPQELEGVFSGDALQLTLPDVYIWSVLLIGDQSLLGEEVAALPTFTPTPTPTPTMHPGTYAEGYILYDDVLAQGWGPGAWGSETNFESTTAVYEGMHAIEIAAQQYDGFGFFAGSALDLSPYSWLVFQINIGQTADPEFAVEFWYQDEPINFLQGIEISPYVVGGPLEPGIWHRVAVPIHILNPGGGLIDQVNFNFRGQGETTLYLDEVRFVAAGLPPTPAPTPTPLPGLSAQAFEAGYIVYADSLTQGWSLDPWSGTADLGSLANVYQGTSAVEVTLDPSGAVTFDVGSFDTSAYDLMVFYLNGGETADQELYVEMFSEGSPVGRANLADYTDGGMLQPGQWHLVMVPLSILNPDGKDIAWFDVGDSLGNGASTFYIDEIRFVAFGP